MMITKALAPWYCSIFFFFIKILLIFFEMNWKIISGRTLMKFDNFDKFSKFPMDGRTRKNSPQQRLQILFDLLWVFPICVYNRLYILHFNWKRYCIYIRICKKDYQIDMNQNSKKKLLLDNCNGEKGFMTLKGCSDSLLISDCSNVYQQGWILF